MFAFLAHYTELNGSVNRTVNWEEYGNNSKSPLSSDGKTHNQVDHTLVDRWHSCTLSSMGADCDTDHYLLVAKVGERLAISK
jgi:hypothetical protein